MLRLGVDKVDPDPGLKISWNERVVLKERLPRLRPEAHRPTIHGRLADKAALPTYPPKSECHVVAVVEAANVPLQPAVKWPSFGNRRSSTKPPTVAHPLVPAQPPESEV